MIKLILSFLLMLCVQVSTASAYNRYELSELRNSYLAASKSEEAADLFYDKMEKYEGKEPVVLGYKAASEAVMAKYAWNPYTKIRHLKKAAAIFEEAVALDKQNPEIRFLRFIVEGHIPDYLDMSPNLVEDKAIVINSLAKHPRSGINPALAETMRDYMLRKDRCNEAEKQLLESINF